MPPRERFGAPPLKPCPSGDWRRALYEVFGGQIDLVARPKGDPIMVRAGRYELPPDMHEDVERERQYLARLGRDNEVQAVLAGPADFSVDPIVMHYRTIEYAAVRALRRRHAALLVLSASVFPVCWERRCLYLQKRSPTADLGPSLLYGFAGAFQPASGADRGSLVLTALRELEEETGLAARYEVATPLGMFQDNATASLEFILLGLNLRPVEAERLCHSAEGDIVTIPFDELPELLRQRDLWTAGGRFVVLSWLMLGGEDHADAFNLGGQAPASTFWSALETGKP